MGYSDHLTPTALLKQKIENNPQFKRIVETIKETGEDASYVSLLSDVLDANDTAHNITKNPIVNFLSRGATGLTKVVGKAVFKATAPKPIQDVVGAVAGVASKVADSKLGQGIDRTAKNLLGIENWHTIPSVRKAVRNTSRAVVNKIGKPVIEKFYSTPDKAVQYWDKKIADQNYRELEAILKTDMRDSDAAPMIEEMLADNPRLTIEAWLNNPEVFKRDPYAAMDKYSQFNFERPEMASIFKDLEPEAATELGDVLMDIAQREGINNFADLITYIRENPVLFQRDLRAMYADHPISGYTPYRTGQFFRNRVAPNENWGQMRVAHNIDNPYLEEMIPNNLNEFQNVRAGELNRFIENRGMIGASEIFDEMQGSYSDSGRAPTEYEDAISKYEPSEYEDAISSDERSQYDDAMSEAPTEYEDAAGYRDLAELTNRPQSLISKRFNGYMGKALKGMGKVSDVLMAVDAADLGAKNLMSYKEAINDHGVVNGLWQGFKSNLGRGWNYLNDMYEGAKSSSVFHKLNEYLPKFDNYESEYVHPDQELKQEGNFFEQESQKVSNIGSNLKNFFGGETEDDEQLPQQSSYEHSEYNDDYSGAHNPIGHPAFSASSAGYAGAIATGMQQERERAEGRSTNAAPNLLRSTGNADDYLML